MTRRSRAVAASPRASSRASRVARRSSAWWPSSTTRSSSRPSSSSAPRRSMRGPDPDTPEGKKPWDEIKRKALDSLIDSQAGPAAGDRAQALGDAGRGRPRDRARSRSRTSSTTRTLPRGAQAAGLHARELSQEPASSRSSSSRSSTPPCARRVTRQRRRGEAPTTSRTSGSIAGEQHGAPAADPRSRCRPIAPAPTRSSARSAWPPRWSSWRAAAQSFAELAKQYSRRRRHQGRRRRSRLGRQGRARAMRSTRRWRRWSPSDVRGPIRTDRGWLVLQLVERKAGDLKPVRRGQRAAPQAALRSAGREGAAVVDPRAAQESAHRRPLLAAAPSRAASRAGGRRARCRWMWKTVWPACCRC